ncbi:MAG: hypothetical protein Ct9H300mP21_00410 [Pseudomonadota bacterium]|nr:MAG: hypothetical protein Ct9H300mP21_00410 [Pseudomonadota bacterium]
MAATRRAIGLQPLQKMSKQTKGKQSSKKPHTSGGARNFLYRKKPGTFCEVPDEKGVVNCCPSGRSQSAPVKY